MMHLFRTSSPKRRKSLQFVSTHAGQAALSQRLENKGFIDEVFSRSTPIPKNFETRFGPEGFQKNPFYASEKKDTTYYEFAYCLLRRQSVLGFAVQAVCFQIVFQGKNKPFDISTHGDATQILDPMSYTAAHAWLLGEKNIHEAIRYPSVRDPNGGGINFAVFERDAVGETSIVPEEIEFTPQANGTVDLLFSPSRSGMTVKPNR